MTPQIQINIDCADLDRMVEFYTAALEYVPFGSQGRSYRSIVPDSGHGPKIVFQRVPEAKVAKNRVHLDLIVGDRVDAEAERFVALGATRLSDAPIEEGGTYWLVLADPEGNELCLCHD